MRLGTLLLHCTCFLQYRGISISVTLALFCLPLLPSPWEVEQSIWLVILTERTLEAVSMGARSLLSLAEEPKGQFKENDQDWEAEEKNQEARVSPGSASLFLSISQPEKPLCYWAISLAVQPKPYLRGKAWVFSTLPWLNAPFVVVQSLSRVPLFVTPWTTAL